MEEQRRFLVVVGLGVLACAGFSFLLHNQAKSIEERRQEIATVEQELDNGRKLTAKTPELEREVILQRETDEVIATILPDEEAILDFVRDLRKFAEQSGVHITSIKNKVSSSPNQKSKDAFEKVAYAIQFESDAFQMLAYLNLVESHERFMRVPSFQLRAASRPGIDELEIRHSVTMDVETYVYMPRSEQDPAKIEAYDRKRDLLVAEIAERAQDLVIPVYDYAGDRNRRDPWIDPRVELGSEVTEVLSIEEQLAIVDDLVERTNEATSMWEVWRDSQTLVEEMKARSELETQLASLEADIRRVESEGALLFLSAERRFRLDVVGEVERLRDSLAQIDGRLVPLARLQELLTTMHAHLDQSEWTLAIAAYETLEPQLAFAEQNDLRRPLVLEARRLAEMASIVLEFSSLEIEVSGVATIGDDSRAAIVNGVVIGVGDLIQVPNEGGELPFVRAIHEQEIEFVFKGIVLTLPI